MPFAPKTYTFLCGCFAALGSILFGYDLGVIAAVLPAPDFLRVTGNPDDNYIGFIVSSLTLGAFVGCLPASLIADKFSRRTAIFIGALIFLLGGTLQTAAQNKGMMLAGRFFAGVSIGMLSLLAPLYQSEIAHPSIRGRLTTLQQFFLGIGAFVAGWIGYATTQTQWGTALQWRLPLGFQIMPAVPLAAMIFLLPESPRWLMIVGREQEALATLARLHARGNERDAFVVAEFSEMKAKIQEERELESAWKQIFNDPNNLRKVMIGVILQFSVQMTGVSVLQYYSARVFDGVGFKPNTTFLLQSINGALALVAQAACVFLVDRLGRRWPLIIGNIVSGATFIGATAIQAKFAHGNGGKSDGYAFVAMTWIFNIAFSSCIGPLSWAIPVEIMNTSIRAKATALTSMSCWIANFMIGQISPKVFTLIDWRYYIVFAVCGFSNALVFWAILPETKGRTLEEMDDYFRNTNWFVPSSTYETIKATDREEKMRDGLAGVMSPSDEKGDILQVERGTSF